VVDQQVTLEDLGSANGTTLNSQRVAGTATLKDGDTLHFERSAYTVAIKTPQLEAAPDDSDATVVNMAPFEDDSDATVVNMAPAEAPAPAPAPAPSPAPAPAPAPALDLPGSWVDEPAGEFTRILSLEDAAAEAGAEMNVECASDLPHLIISTESVSWVMELDPATGDEVDVWEIGRAESCQIVIADDSISSTHCQLIHQNGRWRLVNLVSTNGIYVNGKKSLKAYLADGDQIKLGMATLIFKVGSGAAGTTASDRSANGTGGKLLLRFALAAGTAAVAVGLWWFFS
jgi:pSer/pThr/pTyr-binding forkhead associated (FHA) protein